MAAHKGSSHYMWQRLTAIILLPLALILVLVAVSLVGADYQTVRQSLAMPVMWLPLLALVLTGTWHMWLGMQVIIDDYARGVARSALHLASAIFAVTMAIAAVAAIYQLSFGA
jgi:succinate dehydrogenase / fumarate reductase membrane anchor subunit